MRVREILRSKGDVVVTISPDASVLDAMRLLVQHNIGSVVVFDGEMRGILTERDLLRAGSEDPKRLTEGRVDELMTRDVITASPDADLRQVMDIMTERRIRHLPILKKGQLRGMISIGDVVNSVRQDAEQENRYLHAYIAGVPT
jgi:CBS domain-containing protein